MILATLLKHQVKSVLRSKNIQGSVFKTIYWLFLGGYMFVILLVLGFFVRKGIVSGEVTLGEFMGTIFPYLILAGITIRLLLASHAKLNIDYYKTLPIKKSSLSNYILIKPFINPINYGLCIFLLPTLFSFGKAFDSGWEFLNFVIITNAIIAFNILISGYLSRKFSSSIIPLILSAALTAGIGALQYYNILSVERTAQIFSPIFEIPLGFMPMLIAAATLYFTYKRWLIKNCYTTISGTNEKGLRSDKFNFSALENSGEIGTHFSLMLKLILRNKRTKKTLYFCPIIILYGLLLRNPSQEIGGLTIFISTFVTSGLILLFSTFTYSMDGKYFDGLMSKNISVHSYITSYYYFFAASSTICFMLSLFYYFIDKAIFYSLFPSFLYNIGVNLPLVLWIVTYFTRKLDINQGGAMNMQGASFKDFLFTLPIIVLPSIIITILQLFFSTNTSLIIFGSIGVVGIVIHKPLLKAITKNFIKRKYVIADSFRAK